MRSFRRSIVFIALAVVPSILSAQESGTTQPKKFDAVSSASIYRSFRLDSGTVYGNRAELYWWERYDRDKVLSYDIMWGTQKEVFDDTLHLLDQLRPKNDDNRVTKLITITPLMPNTVYYCRALRDYNRDLDTCDFLIDTRTAVLSHPIRRYLNKGRYNRIELYSIDGKRHLHTQADGSIGTGSIAGQNRLSGLYIITFKNNTETVKSEKMIFGR